MTTDSQSGAARQPAPSPQEALKRAAARAALDELVDDSIVGVGTGSTVNHFIDLLAERKERYRGAVSSSEASTRRMQALGIPVFDLNEVVDSGQPIPVYVDGADELNCDLEMIKGGGGALTREKIVAAAAERFVCIVDRSKLVDTLGQFPLPIEVIPMARASIAARLRELGARVTEREGFVTDNGNLILDVAGLRIERPAQLEAAINDWPGVVTVGLFAMKAADVALIATAEGVERRSRALD
ncbi:MAG: ribose-5-phosphate isomerase RpiA [Burkholderiaceae bacterium]